jgi:signal transduction histidine kinase
LAVQLVVSDSGIGISRDQVAKIFEPFFQVDSSSTRAFGGTGLGLTLAKAYVEAHGGRIWVDTAPGQGSTFTATFPVRTTGGLPT